jgi:hypothetical protein
MPRSGVLLGVTIKDGRFFYLERRFRESDMLPNGHAEMPGQCPQLFFAIFGEALAA